MRRSAAGLVLAAVVWSGLPGVRLTASPPDPAGAEFFERKVRPVLVEHCFKCHSADAEKTKKLRGGLRLDTRDGVRTGGDSGPALVPGKPGESLLVKAIKGDDEVSQ